MEMGGAHFQNSSNPRVLFSVKINTIFLKMVFPLKEMGIQWVPTGYQRVEKAITMRFRKWNAHACRHFVFHNALHQFMLCDNISTGSQYVNLHNKIKYLSLALFFFQPHR